MKNIVNLIRRIFFKKKDVEVMYNDYKIGKLKELRNHKISNNE